MVFEQRHEDFINYLRFERRYSHHTVAAYKRDLDQFLQYLLEQFGTLEAEQVTHYHIRSWLAELKEDKQTARTINRKLSTLSSYFRYLMKHEVLRSNPVKKLHAMKLPERLPTYVKEQDMDHLLEETPFSEGFKGMTERLIFELLYQTGMRRSELLGLQEADIEWSLKQIRVLGKGNKERLLPVSSMLLEHIKDYIEAKKIIDNHDERHLLIRENGQPLSAEYVYTTVKQYLSGATTLKKRSPHVLRHSFATHLLNNGANIQAIKDLLGHSSLAATQVYTHVNVEKLKEIHKLNHPRG